MESSTYNAGRTRAVTSSSGTACGHESSGFRLSGYLPDMMRASVSIPATDCKDHDVTSEFMHMITINTCLNKLNFRAESLELFR